MIWVTSTAILVGMYLLIAALRPIGRIMAMLPTGGLRLSWGLLRIFVMGFISGYAAMAVLGLQRSIDGVQLILSVILLFGGLFVLIVARLSSLTTDAVRRVRELEGEVTRDALTGLSNRRHMERALAHEIAGARRSARPLSVLLVDLDHFKSVNDMHGHLAGDEVLRHVGGILARTVRSADTAVRYGGEKFLVIAPGCDEAAAIDLGRTILDALRASPTPLPGGGMLTVTCSIGSASLEDGIDAGGLIRKADEALYEAKRSGRDRVVLFPGEARIAA